MAHPRLVGEQPRSVVNPAGLRHTATPGCLWQHCFAHDVDEQADEAHPADYVCTTCFHAFRTVQKILDEQARVGCSWDMCPHCWSKIEG